MFPGGSPRVEVVPVGDVSSHAIDAATESLAEQFDVDPVVAPGIELPADPGDLGCYHGLDLVDAVLEASDADIALGVTAEPIELGSRSFVFGVADVGGRGAVVSTSPLRGDEETFRERVGKQAVKQVARTFGIAPDHGDCVATPTDTVADLDSAPPRLCLDCQGRLRDPDGPEPPSWQVESLDWDESVEANVSSVPVQVIEIVVRRLRTVVGSNRVAGRARSALGVLPSPSEIDLPRAIRMWVHVGYQTARFWTVVVLFLASAFLVLVAELELHDRVAGGEPATTTTWGFVIVALLVGYLLQSFVRGLVWAIVTGVREGLREI